ncbi:MAG: DUF927 domain-containing protein [Ruminococcus sp.]|nr:DUF927 domain-containing protein [Ruminococcus sp.]
MIKKRKKSEIFSFIYKKNPDESIVEKMPDTDECIMQEEPDSENNDIEISDNKPEIKLVSYNDRYNDENHIKENDNDEQFVEKNIKKVKPNQSRFNLNSVETAIDGVEYIPLNVSVYSNIPILESEKEVAREIGRPSLVKTERGNLVPCTVVKTSNAFCIVQKVKDSNKNISYELIWMMHRIDIQKKVKAKDGKVYVDTIIADDSGEKIIRIPMIDFSENHINNLMKYNISLNPYYSTTMSVYFQRILEEMPMQDANQSLGIVYDSDKKDFAFNAYDILDGFTYQTEYENWEDYADAFNELVEPSSALQYLIATAMSAPILTLLQKKHNIDVHSYCVNIVGSSSTGKTISSRFCSALWTNPKSDKIFSAMLATSNASLKRLDGRYGIPTMLDESTVSGGINPTEYAYSVYEEREKRRLNSDCSEKESGTWSTIVIMSSEQHFHDNSKVQNGGIAVRVHSMENLTFTVDEDHAEALNEFIRENWGMVGYQFTEQLFGGSFGDIEERYKKSKENMREYVKDSVSGFTERLVSIYAMTYMTAEMLQNMGLAIKPESVAEIMAAHNRMVSDEQNLAVNAKRAIVSYIVRNPYKQGFRKFEDENGFLTKIAIEESLLREILNRAGFTDLKVTIKEMDKANMIVHQQKGRIKSKLTIDGNIGYCYQFDMKDVSEGVEPEKTKEKKQIQYEEDEDFYNLD